MGASGFVWSFSNDFAEMLFLGFGFGVFGGGLKTRRPFSLEGLSLGGGVVGITGGRGFG